MNTNRSIAFILFLIVSLILSGISFPAVAQEEQPFESNDLPPVSLRDRFPGQPVQNSDGIWYMPESSSSVTSSDSYAPAAAGGPDSFGYTWDDSVTFDWIDASGGTNTGIGDYVLASGPINIGFDFKFYENIYNQIYVVRHGYATFSNLPYYDDQSQIPNSGIPNDVIAPHWVPVDLVSGYINYMYGGTDPNRYFVVEWNNVVSYSFNDDPETYTFQMILHENGDIVFQYKTLTRIGGSLCVSSGIEDSLGVDGLAVTPFCSIISSDHAVRIYRPPAGPRVNITPLQQYSFTSSDQTITFPITIQNTGETGSDVYDLSVPSDWPVTLFSADGSTPLTDTDTDGTVDTGTIPQDGSINIVAAISTPGGATAGDNRMIALSICSSLNTVICNTASLQAAVPAPFVQAFVDYGDSTMSLYYIKPGSQTVKPPTTQLETNAEFAVVERPGGGFIHVWNRYSTNYFTTYRNLYYSVLNQYREILLDASQITDNSSVIVSTSDYFPAAAATPDGKIGIMWMRSQAKSSSSGWVYNTNIYFAILDQNGNFLFGPENLTMNSDWGRWSTPDVPQFNYFKIAATGDNRFFLTWDRETYLDDCSTDDCYFNDIYYSVYSSTGSPVKGITKFTADSAGTADFDGYHYPTVSAIQNNRVMLAYSRSYDNDIYYSVFDSSGNVLNTQTRIPGSGFYDNAPDIAQLSDGRILIANDASMFDQYLIRFAVLDANYNLAVPAASLANPPGTVDSMYVSVTADNAGHGILTWMDSGYSSAPKNLYYALIDSSGSVLTPPMIYRTNSPYGLPLLTSDYGCGNTSFSTTMPAGIDTAVSSSSSLLHEEAGDDFPIDIKVANHGQTTATDVTLTVTLGSGMDYLYDTSDILPTVDGDTVTWNLPDLGFLDEFNFAIYVGIPDVEGVNSYPFTFQVTPGGIETASADNTFDGEVVTGYLTFLPMLTR